jgi:hypothetical protein
MPDSAPVRPPLDEAAALEWLRGQPGRRTNLPAAELGRGMAATARQPAPEGLAEAGPRHPTRRGLHGSGQRTECRHRRGRTMTADKRRKATA